MSEEVKMKDKDIEEQGNEQIKEEKGEAGRTNRDMQAVAESYEDGQSFDVQKIERVQLSLSPHRVSTLTYMFLQAIDLLVKIREIDLKRPAERPFLPRYTRRLLLSSSATFTHFTEKPLMPIRSRSLYHHHPSHVVHHRNS